jgi:hypothetical protein
VDNDTTVEVTNNPDAPFPAPNTGPAGNEQNEDAQVEGEEREEEDAEEKGA